MRQKSLFGAALATLLLAGCGSTGALDDILGGGSSTPATYEELRGTVEYVDTRDRFILLRNVAGYVSRLAGGTGGDEARVYYDTDTRVLFQNATYEPEDLERGDQVAVDLASTSNQLVADEITVLYDSSGESGTGTTGDTIRGTVRYIDTSRRTIEVDAGNYAAPIVLDYDANTFVQHDGRRFEPTALERGDQIEIEVRNLGGGRLLAEEIYVIRDVSGSSDANLSVLRGTVTYVDTARRTIGLDQASWIRQFDTGGTTGTLILQYDANTPVEYQGQIYAPANLERGDVIEVEVSRIGTNTYEAERIAVVRDVNYR